MYGLGLLEFLIVGVVFLLIVGRHRGGGPTHPAVNETRRSSIFHNHWLQQPRKIAAPVLGNVGSARFAC